MKNIHNRYIKTDENIILNEKYIRWIQKIHDCLYICSKQDGCTQNNTHKICKVNSLESYQKLNKFFE